MNDRHPSGEPTPTDPSADASYGHPAAYEPYGQQDLQPGYAAYDSYATGTFDNLGAGYGDGTPPFGTPAGGHETPNSGAYQTGSYGTGSYATGAYDTGAYTTGAFDATGYDTGAQPAAGYDPYAHTAHSAQPPYDTGSYETTGYGYSFAAGADTTGTFPGYGATGGSSDTTAVWSSGGYEAAGGIPAQSGAPHGDTGYPYDTGATGQWDTGAWGEHTGHYEAGAGAQTPPGAQYETGQWDATGQWDTGSYPASAAGPEGDAATAHAADAGAPHDSTHDTAVFEPYEAPYEDAEGGETAAAGTGAGAGAEGAAPAVPSPGSPGRRDAQGRGRRRTAKPAKRSALLTVAVPSVAAMGVCAVAAASVSGIGGGDDKDSRTTRAATDPAAVKPAVANAKLDTQLAGLSSGADDFADRASRTQERIDLKARQAAEKKRKAEEAARKEAMRPKFLLPVKQHGLSAYYGQAGVNWMSVHSGIDFPVSYGTPVMAATDGTVRTQWNPAYGNMAIVTAADGTETWYCHLSSTRVRSGSVKAGDPIAYSGNSGNSTGPHLHFEVRPGGGSAIDPLPWLRSHGLDPT